MQFDLKPLPDGSVRAALDKAKHYRLLNEPWESESICLDVLRTEPKNQDTRPQNLELMWCRREFLPELRKKFTELGWR